MRADSYLLVISVPFFMRGDSVFAVFLIPFSSASFRQNHIYIRCCWAVFAPSVHYELCRNIKMIFAPPFFFSVAPGRDGVSGPFVRSLDLPLFNTGLRALGEAFFFAGNSFLLPLSPAEHD